MSETPLERFFEALKDYQDIKQKREEERNEVENFFNKFTFGEKKFSLFTHQRACVEWLSTLRKQHNEQFVRKMGGILADEMGMGKTIEILGYFKYLRNKGVPGPFLVIVPLQTLSEWNRKIIDFNLTPIVIKARESWEGKQKKENEEKIKNWDNIKENTVVVTTNTFVSREKGKSYKKSWFTTKKPWTVIVVDEAHDKLTGVVHEEFEWEGDDDAETEAAKKKKGSNYETQFKKALKELGNDKKTQIILATGTPLKKKWQELANLYSFVVPKELPEEFLDPSFESHSIDPLIDDFDQHKDDFQRYQEITANIMLRRGREDFVENEQKIESGQKPKVRITNTTVVLDPTEKQDYIIKELFFANRVAGSRVFGDNLGLLHVDKIRKQSKTKTLRPAPLNKYSYQMLLDHPDLLRVNKLSFDPAHSAKAHFLSKLIQNRFKANDLKMLVFFTSRRIMEYMFDYYNFHKDNEDTTNGKVGMIYGSEVRYKKLHKPQDLDLLDTMTENLRKKTQEIFLKEEFNPHTNIYTVIQRQLEQEEKDKRTYFGSRGYYEDKIKEMVKAIAKNKNNSSREERKVMQDMIEEHNKSLKKLDRKKKDVVGYMEKQAQRDLFIDGFNVEGGPFNLLLINVTAGAAGINLGEATTVVFYQSSGSPNLEAQAQARAFRLTSQTNANVFRLVTRNTSEEWSMLNPYTERLEKAFFMTRYTEENKGNFLTQFDEKQGPQNISKNLDKWSHASWENHLIEDLKSKPTVKAELKRSHAFFAKFNNKNLQKGAPKWYFYWGVNYATEKEVPVCFPSLSFFVFCLCFTLIIKYLFCFALVQDNDRQVTIKRFKEEIQSMANCLYFNLPIPPDPFFRRNMCSEIDSNCLDLYMHPQDRDGSTNLLPKSVELLETIGKLNIKAKKYESDLRQMIFNPPNIYFAIALKKSIAAFDFKKPKTTIEEEDTTTTNDEQDSPKKKTLADLRYEFLKGYLDDETLFVYDSTTVEDSSDEDVDYEFFNDFLRDEDAWDNIIYENQEQGFVLALYNEQTIKGFHIFLFARIWGKEKIRLRVLFFHTEGLHQQIENIKAKIKKYTDMISNEKKLKGQTYYKLKTNSNDEQTTKFTFFLKPQDRDYDIVLTLDHKAFEFNPSSEEIIQHNSICHVIESPFRTTEDKNIEVEVKSSKQDEDDVLFEIKAPEGYEFTQTSIEAAASRIKFTNTFLGDSYAKNIPTEHVSEFSLKVKPQDKDSIVTISFMYGALQLYNSESKTTTWNLPFSHSYEPENTPTTDQCTIKNCVGIKVEKFQDINTNIQVEVTLSGEKLNFTPSSIAAAEQYFAVSNAQIVDYPQITAGIQIEQENDTWADFTVESVNDTKSKPKTYTQPETEDADYKLVDKYEVDLFFLKKEKETFEYIAEKHYDKTIKSIYEFGSSQTKEQKTLAKLLSIDLNDPGAESGNKTPLDEKKETESDDEGDEDYIPDETTKEEEDKKKKHKYNTRFKSVRQELKVKRYFKNKEEITRFIKFSEDIFKKEKLELSLSNETDESLALEFTTIKPKKRSRPKKVLV